MKLVAGSGVDKLVCCSGLLFLFYFILFIYLFFLKDFIYLFMRDTERERQREKQAPCGESDAGLNPRTLGSQPEPKAAAQP